MHFEPPRIAQTERPDLVARIARADERIVHRDPVGQRRLRMVDVQSQHLAEQAVAALGVVLRIVEPQRRGAAAVARRHVEHAIGTERDHAAVVIAVDARHLEQGDAARGIGDVRIRRTDLEPLQHLPREREPAVQHVERAVGGVVGMEGEAEHAQLAAVGDDALVGQVEERCRQQRAVLDDADPPRQLDDEDAVQVAGRRRDEHWHLQSARDQLQLQRRLGGEGSRGDGAGDQMAHRDDEPTGQHSHGSGVP
jgi:hypothetical protein